jgi:hypothetical protein
LLISEIGTLLQQSTPKIVHKVSTAPCPKHGVRMCIHIKKLNQLSRPNTTASTDGDKIDQGASVFIPGYTRKKAIDRIDHNEKQINARNQM